MLTTRLALAVVLAATALSLPGSASADIPLRPTSPARPTVSTMQPMWFGAEPTVESLCAVDPTGPSSAIAHPITAVRSCADHITDGRSSAAGLTGLSSADVAGNSGQS